jgi:diketogulonate reductase-like aldo/keto reductase
LVDLSQKFQSGIPREEIFITTKVQAGAHTVEGCKKKIEKSLNELDIGRSIRDPHEKDCNAGLGATGYIDLFLIHGPLMGPERRISSWKFITDFARETGKVRSCGVSNL